MCAALPWLTRLSQNRTTALVHQSPQATSISEHSLVGIVPDQHVKGDAVLCFESCNLHSPRSTFGCDVFLNYSCLGAH